MPGNILTNSINLFNTAGNISDAIQEVTGLQDLKSKMDIKEDSKLPSVLKEMLSVAAITVNTALSPVMNAGLRTFEGTEVEKLEEKLTKDFQALIEKDETGTTKKIFEAFAKANEVKNIAIASPADSAAISFVLPLAVGSVAGPIGLGVAAGVIAAQVAVGAKENNAIAVKTDELFHLQDYSHSKMIKNQAMEKLALDNDLKPKALEKLLGIKYEQHVNQDKANLEINNNNISSEKIASTFIKDFGLNIAESTATNIISTGAAVVQGPYAVAAALAKIAISSLANVSENISNEQAKSIIDEKISQLRTEGPSYKAVKDKLPSYRKKANRQFNIIRKKLGLSEVKPEEIKVSRKYDLANKAMDEKINSLALEKLAQLRVVNAKTEKENKEAQELENSFSILAKTSAIKEKDKKEEYKNSKKYKDALDHVHKKFLEEKGNALEEVKKNPLYQYEQIHKPKTRLGSIKKRLHTAINSSASFLAFGKKTYSFALDSINTKIEHYKMQREDRQNKHKEIVKIANKIKEEKKLAAKAIKKVNKVAPNSTKPEENPTNFDNKTKKNRTFAAKIEGAGHKFLKTVKLNTKEHLNPSAQEDKSPVAAQLNLSSKDESLNHIDIATDSPTAENKEAATKLVEMIKQNVDKQKIIEHIKECSKETLSSVHDIKVNAA